MDPSTVQQRVSEVNEKLRMGDAQAAYAILQELLANQVEVDFELVPIGR